MRERRKQAEPNASKFHISAPRALSAALTAKLRYMPGLLQHQESVRYNRFYARANHRCFGPHARGWRWAHGADFRCRDSLRSMTSQTSAFDRESASPYAVGWRPRGALFRPDAGTWWMSGGLGAFCAVPQGDDTVRLF